MYLKNIKVIHVQADNSTLFFYELYKWISWKERLHIKLRTLWIVNFGKSTVWDFFLSKAIKKKTLE